ncbi:glycosyltransferase family 2 protein [Vibrio coralliirubri]|uniref:glycosyltransferase family 2 protein n=1 Tax=Vibrio coralliirubri TaxID=1516159 RepID=UPI0006998231|nr:glycosyltransferase family 2 protein [Vibrio coralliirubri]
MINNLKVSVVIPCYNSEKTIERALDSINEQSYKVSEIIIVDDASIDKTRDVISDWISSRKSHSIIKFIENCVNSGVSASRNIGIAEASCDLIAFLDSDDAWNINKVKYQVSFFSSDPQLYLSFHGSENLSDKNVLTKFVNLHQNEKPLTKYSLLIKNTIPTRSVMMRNDKCFKFNESMSYSEDYDFWLRVCLSGRKIINMNVVLAYSFEDEHHTGLSSHKVKMHNGVLETYRNIYKSKLISRRMYFFLTGFQKFKNIYKRLVK